MRRSQLLSFLLMLICSLTCCQNSPKKAQPWLILLSEKATKKELKGFNPIIFDYQAHPPLQGLSSSKRGVYARLELDKLFAFVDKERPHKIIVDELVDVMIPELLTTGFNGLFLDGLYVPDKKQSSPIAVRDPGDFVSWGKQLLLLLEARYSKLPILIHGTPSFLKDFGRALKGVVASSVLTRFDSDKQTYELVDEKAYRDRIDELHKLQDLYPHLEIYTLDFWDPEDRKMIASIYNKEREEGFHPYVTNYQMNQIVRDFR